MERARSGEGTLEPQIPKAGDSADPPHPQPEAAEVESARLLANAAREALGDAVDDERLRRLADEFISTGGQGDLTAFLEWLTARDPALARHAAQARSRTDPPDHEAGAAGGAETRDTAG